MPQKRFFFGETYKNEQAALKFINCSVDTEKETTSALVKNSRFSLS